MSSTHAGMGARGGLSNTQPKAMKPAPINSVTVATMRNKKLNRSVRMERLAMLAGVCVDAALAAAQAGRCLVDRLRCC